MVAPKMVDVFVRCCPNCWTNGFRTCSKPSSLKGSHLAGDWREKGTQRSHGVHVSFVWPEVPPTVGSFEAGAMLEGRSSRLLQDEFPHLRKRHRSKCLWPQGYLCTTVGSVDEKTISEYMENQEWDEDGEGIKITTPAEP